MVAAIGNTVRHGFNTASCHTVIWLTIEGMCRLLARVVRLLLRRPCEEIGPLL
jgi:hypothetical protein